MFQSSSRRATAHLNAKSSFLPSHKRKKYHTLTKKNPCTDHPYSGLLHIQRRVRVKLHFSFTPLRSTISDSPEICGRKCHDKNLCHRSEVILFHFMRNMGEEIHMHIFPQKNIPLAMLTEAFFFNGYVTFFPLKTYLRYIFLRIFLMSFPPYRQAPANFSVCPGTLLWSVHHVN